MSKQMLAAQTWVSPPWPAPSTVQVGNAEGLTGRCVELERHTIGYVLRALALACVARQALASAPDVTSMASHWGRMPIWGWYPVSPILGVQSPVERGV